MKFGISTLDLRKYIIFIHDLLQFPDLVLTKHDLSIMRVKRVEHRLCDSLHSCCNYQSVSLKDLT